MVAAEKNEEYGGDDSSYGGYFTNVEIMERYVDKAKGFQHSLSTYIEGAGTQNKDKDMAHGYIFGKDITGVPKKVEQGMVDVVTKINEKVKKTVIIEELILDVFGFSRGAAGARYFIYQALRDEKHIKARLQEQGYTVKKVEVHFAGLYDTVSTYGYLIMFGANNIKALKLDAVHLVKKKVVQLAAADEHREYFSLTNIQSAGYKGREIFLPGVHSDLGGGYRDNAKEGYLIYRSSESHAIEEQRRLIDSGWFGDEQELKIKTFYVRRGKSRVKMASLKADRKSISNKYSLIPLHIMAEFARDNDIALTAELEIEESVPSILSTVKKNIDAYIAEKQHSGSKADDWADGNRAWEKNKVWLKALRHDYLHFSARLEMGHKARTSFWEGERYRKVYNG